MDELKKLLEENNFLLHKIIEQNQLIFTITQKNIHYYSQYYYWWSFESDEVKQLRKKLDALQKQITDQNINEV